MNPTNFKERVAETFGLFIEPEEGEGWKALHDRLQEEIFNSTFSPEKQLLQASSFGCERAISIILGTYTDMDIDAREGEFYPTALMIAARKGHAEATRLLLKKGADITVPFIKGISTLYFAYQSESLETVRACLEFDAQLDYEVAKKIVEKQDDAAVTLFQEFSQTLDVEDKHNKTPIFEIIEKEGLIDIKKLNWAIDAGCSVNHIDNRGATPLHYAFGRNVLSAIECLSNHGAKAVEDHNGNTPLHYLLFEGNPEDQWELSKMEYELCYKRLKTKLVFKALSISLTALNYYLRVKNWMSPAISKAEKED